MCNTVFWVHHGIPTQDLARVLACVSRLSFWRFAVIDSATHLASVVNFAVCTCRVCVCVSVDYAPQTSANWQGTVLCMCAVHIFHVLPLCWCFLSEVSTPYFCDVSYGVSFFFFPLWAYFVYSGLLREQSIAEKCKDWDICLVPFAFLTFYFRWK